MTALDYILEGLEAELALERELGVRSIEFSYDAPPYDAPLARRLLTLPPTPPSPPSPNPQPRPQPAAPAPEMAEAELKIEKSINRKIEKSINSLPHDFVFLHDRPLAGVGAEMIAKITAAMGRTPDTAPVIVEGDMPKAQLYVVLGDRALKKWFPGIHAGPGMWITGSDGEEALITYSPNYFLRFGTVTPAVQKIKAEMWKSLKGVLQRLALKRK